MRRPDRTTFWYAGAGVLAAVFAVAVAHLASALLNPASSPVLAVGSVVIDATPTPVKEWAVRELGTADKPILIGSVVACTLLLAAIAGVLSRRRPGLGLGLTALLVLLAGAAALTGPEAEAVDALPALVAVVFGPSTLWWLIRTLGRSQAESTVPGAADGPSRRSLLVGSGLLIAGALAGGAGQWIVRARTRIADIVLPRPAQVLPELPAGLESEYAEVTAFRTTNRAFYRVDTKLTVPIVDPDSWSLTVDGDVREELRYRYDYLLAMPLVERDITLTCVSNEVGGKLAGSARWLGVPLTTLLDRAGVGSGADQILSTDVDGFTIGTPRAVATDGRDALVAVGMNGEPLPRSHGFPARLVVPGIYGFVGATKWLTRLTLTTYAAEQAYWTERDWATAAPIKVASRIDTPKPLSTVEAGRHVIGGVAWAQHVGIAAVQVRIDGEPWQRAHLGPDAGVDYWRQWYLPWDAEAGRHTLAVRAVDNDGNAQTAARTTPFPAGSSGIQEVVVSVS